MENKNLHNTKKKVNNNKANGSECDEDMNQSTKLNYTRIQTYDRLNADTNADNMSVIINRKTGNNDNEVLDVKNQNETGTSRVKNGNNNQNTDITGVLNEKSSEESKVGISEKQNSDNNCHVDNIDDSTDNVNNDNSSISVDFKRKVKPESLSLEINHQPLENSKSETKLLQYITSPSSSFTSSVLEGCSTSFIGSIVLCHWDNIVGPRISHVWKLSENFEISQRLLKMIAIQTLNGEICRDPLDPNIDTKFFTLRDYNLTVSSYIFGAAKHGELSIHSLCLLIPCEKRKAYNTLSDLCSEWIKRLVGKLKIFLEKESADDASILLSTQMFYFVQMLISLKESGLPASIPLCDSHFYPEHRIDPSFLRRAISSHLITAGRSIVIGPNSSQVNLMISTLAMFLPARERVRCRYVGEKQLYPYYPELPIQGILQDADGQLVISLKEIYLSSYPSSLIDLTTKDVRISSYVHKHYHTRHKALIQELNCLWKGKQNGSYPLNDMFRAPDDPETIVKDFLTDLDLVPPLDNLKEQFIDNFVRCLEKKAMALIKYVENESDEGRKPNAVKRKKLRQDFSLTVPGDFKIVLGVADKLQPGFYGFLYQDRISEYMTSLEVVTSPPVPPATNLTFSDSFS